MKIPRKLKKAIKNWCSVCCEPFCFRYRSYLYYVTLLSNGRLLFDKLYYVGSGPVSLLDLSLACNLEDKLNKISKIGIYE